MMPAGSSEGANAVRPTVSDRMTRILPARADRLKVKRISLPQMRRMIWGTIRPTKPRSPAKLTTAAAQAAAQAGQPVEYYHCSSDPDSLDGIALPDLGWAMMDGTAPHVYDPVTPGARDTLVSLGGYLDEAAMRPKAKEISALQEEISQRFRRCYRFLSAAGQLAKLSAPTELRKDAIHGLAQEWTADLPRRGGHGSCRRLFATETELECTRYLSNTSGILRNLVTFSIRVHSS